MNVLIQVLITLIKIEIYTSRPKFYPELKMRESNGKHIFHFFGIKLNQQIFDFIKISSSLRNLSN